MEQLLERTRAIKLLLLDVDGVLTDGTLYFGNDGEAMKAFNIYDGIGIKWLQRNGIQVGIVTGRSSEIVARRTKDLGITIVVQGREDKLVAVRELAAQLKLQLNEIAYMGDDLPDLTAIFECGVGFAPANASDAILNIADWVTPARGGEGAVREVCEFILKAQGKYDALVDSYRR